MTAVVFSISKEAQKAADSAGVFIKKCTHFTVLHF